ncbi:L-type lectin-domain containing receptor kinase VIII.2-like [Cornus florida]|uniref:L-type lectin-domain containing receptor kinase VIII.2-like n=1 Tax=Cornus florida TaxID=4283 RepID=UPI00289926F1|nr:L-type lectin-domain containing receptor kinase VIII.2-like [Cornus florida]
MSSSSLFRYFIPSHALIFSFLTLISGPIFSFSFPALQNNPNFDSNIALFGDAEIVDGGSSVKLTRPLASSFGLVTYNKPFKFLEPQTTSPTSFSTDFTFSISPENGDGLSLIVYPTHSASKFSGKTSFGLSQEIRFLGIEFDTSMDAAVGDENSNHVGVDVCSLVSARISNVSSVNLVLNSGVKLRSWIDYDASSKRLEVRLSELGGVRPYKPLLTYPIDLSEMWKGEEVFVGISSSSGNSSQTSSVYSWKFRVRNVQSWMHSQPVDPRGYSKPGSEQKTAHKKSFCPLGILPGLLFVIGCGALVAFSVMFLWTVSVRKYTMIPTSHSACPVNFRYEKINVVVEDSSEDVKN